MIDRSRIRELAQRDRSGRPEGTIDRQSMSRLGILRGGCDPEATSPSRAELVGFLEWVEDDLLLMEEILAGAGWRPATESVAGFGFSVDTTGAATAQEDPTGIGGAAAPVLDTLLDASPEEHAALRWRVAEATRQARRHLKIARGRQRTRAGRDISEEQKRLMARLKRAGDVLMAFLKFIDGPRKSATGEMLTIDARLRETDPHIKDPGR